MHISSVILGDAGFISSAVCFFFSSLTWAFQGRVHNAGEPQLNREVGCSSFLVTTYFLLRDYNIRPKKELHLSLWVETLTWNEGVLPSIFVTVLTPAMRARHTIPVQDPLRLTWKATGPELWANRVRSAQQSGRPVIPNESKNCGLLCLNNGLLRGTVAYWSWILGFPGTLCESLQASSTTQRTNIHASLHKILKTTCRISPHLCRIPLSWFDWWSKRSWFCCCCFPALSLGVLAGLSWGLWNAGFIQVCLKDELVQVKF